MRVLRVVIIFLLVYTAIKLLLLPFTIFLLEIVGVNN